MTQLILGSTSPFRKALLEKLNIDFDCAKPEIDETPEDNEPPQSLVARLAEQKAEKVASDHKNALIIGSDQVAVCNGEILGKPGNFDNAVAQLEKFSDQTVTFYTGLCLLNSKTGRSQVIVEPFYVHFKALRKEQIENYINAEKPFNCAGSFKSEGLGICLFKSLEGNDPNSLIGLPLIRLIELLDNEGFDVLARQNGNQPA